MSPKNSQVSTNYKSIKFIKRKPKEKAEEFGIDYLPRKQDPIPTKHIGIIDLTHERVNFMFKGVIQILIVFFVLLISSSLKWATDMSYYLMAIKLFEYVDMFII